MWEGGEEAVEIECVTQESHPRLARHLHSHLHSAGGLDAHLAAGELFVSVFLHHEAPFLGERWQWRKAHPHHISLQVFGRF